MDDVDKFTRRFLENAQNRSKKLGISNMSKMPLIENNDNDTQSQHNSTKTKTASPKRRQSTDRKAKATSPHVKNRAVALRSISQDESKTSLNIDAKENVDLALEINITTGPNVQVQVEVEEQELDADGNVLNTIQKKRKQITAIEDESASAPSSCIRDSSRNQLHRLGALYSNPQDLSSPVHRTETAFAIDQENDTRSGTKLKKSNKLTELANSYNEWEDDSNHRSHKINDSGNKTVDTKYQNGLKSIVKSPKKYDDKISSADKKETENNKNSNNKKLNWDKSIMDSLESQGYKRRDTTNKRLEYDFSDGTDGKKINTAFSNVATKPPSAPAVSTYSAVPSAVSSTANAYGSKGAIPKTKTQTTPKKEEPAPSSM